jgi:nicotinamide-nucleotide amidase
LSARPRAVVLLTGSELVRGDRRDENGAFVARELTRLGLEPARIVVVGDGPGELETAVGEGLAADVCVVSGGLGPTHDDRTVDVLARVAGRAVIVDDALEARIEAFSRRTAERLGRPYADFAVGVRKQASLPEGAVVLGVAGTAPAFLLDLDGRVAAALPGPPAELRRLWPRVADAPAFRAVVERARPPAHRLFRFFGPSESAVARVIEEAGGEGEGTTVTVCAHDLEIRVDMYVGEQGSERADALEAALRERLGEPLFAEDERPVEDVVLDLCRAGGLTLATAESCTGGLVGARLTAVPGASDVYVGGVVAYSNDAKSAHLHVSEDVLANHGAVSAEAAEAMAAGARAAFGADAAIAVTGIAGPGGGTPEKPVGLVFLYAKSPYGDSASRLELPGDRDAVRSRAAAAVLHLLRSLLMRSATDSRDVDE